MRAVKNLFGGGGEEKARDEKAAAPRDEEAAVDRKDDEAKELDNLRNLEWDEMTAEQRALRKTQVRHEMRKKIEKEYETEKKVDQRLAEILKQKDDFEEDGVEYPKGPGSFDCQIGVFEFIKGLAFFILFVTGFLIAISNPSLKTCNTVDTQQTVDYCVISISNITRRGASEFYACVGPGTSTSCCQSAADLAKVESQRQGCIQYISDLSTECLSDGDFESICKDESSCPSRIVSTYKNSLYVFSTSLFIFCLIKLIRGYGLCAVYPKWHYMDFFERKQGCMDKTVLCCTKQGLYYEQWFFVLVHLPCLAWILYNDQYNVVEICGNAEATDGSEWTLPSSVAAFLGVTLALEGSLLILASIVRYFLPVRPELYNPQIQGKHECKCFGTYLDCRTCRVQDFSESSKWCGAGCYMKCQRMHKNCLPRRCRGFYNIIIIPFRILNCLANLLFQLTFGLCGCCLEYFARYKHWIGI